MASGKVVVIINAGPFREAARERQTEDEEATVSDQLITFAQAVDHAEKNHNYRICIEIDAAREMLDQIRGSNSESFTVIAGKYDNQDKSCKYCDHFDTLAQAIEAYDKVSGYPWAYIEYQGRIMDIWGKGAHPLRDDE